MNSLKNKNWLRDSRQITSKVVFEPFVNNKSRIVSAKAISGGFNNIYSQMLENYDNSIPTILDYNDTKKIGYFSGDTASFSLKANKLATQYNSGVHKGEFNIEYSSYNVTDKDGWVVDPDTGNRSPVLLQFNFDTSLENTARYIEIVGDISHGEYPVELQIDILQYSSQDAAESPQFTTYFVKGNNLIHCIVDLKENVKLFEYMQIWIKKWSKPYSSVKLNYVGTDIIFDVSNKDLLLSYQTSCAAKNNGDLDYGLKFNSANIKMYSDDKSYGKLYLSTGDYVSNILNTTDVLVENQSNIKCRFYVRTEMDLKYSYIGKFFAYKVDYNSQADIINISLYDILSMLQSIEFFGIGQTLGSVSLYSILTTVDTFLQTNYNIKINFSDINIKEITKEIYINNPVYESENVWTFLDGCCILGQFYIVANSNNENYDIDIIMER